MNNDALDYAMEVLVGAIPACSYVKLACQRFINDLEREDIWYDINAAERFYKFCRQLKHYKGPDRGKPIELDPWEKFVFGNIYGWKRVDPDLPKERWIWRFKFNYIEVPRKNGKTTISAAAAAYDTAFVEDTGAEVYCLATKEEQAKILWNDIRAFIKMSEDLGEVFEMLEGQNTIYSRDSERTSFVKPLGSNSKKQDGLNPLSAICDELHEWPDRKLLDVIEDAFGARSQWHIIEITTAGYNKQGICFIERKHGIDILEGRIHNDDKFVIIYTIDPEDKDNWRDESVWFKANPSLGRGKQLAYMRSKAQKADEIASELNTFLNKQLDVWTDVLEAWLKWEVWRGCALTYDRTKLAGKKCKVGIDLAKVSDISAVAYYFPTQKGLDKPHVLMKFYCPRDNVSVRVERDKLPYNVWVKEGWIVETPGNTTDFDFIEWDILVSSKQFQIEQIAVDRTFAGEIVNHLMAAGLEIIDFGQGFMSMGSPTAELERLLTAKEIYHNGNPVLDWMSSNVVIRKDPAGNMKPDKDNSPEKIDGIVALIMAIGLTLARRDPKKKSPYEKRGMRSLSTTAVKEAENEKRFLRI